MGPRSDNRGYRSLPAREPAVTRVASMGPRSDNRGYIGPQLVADALLVASMGPRSDNRGYKRTSQPTWCRELLQWVRGRITAVMGCWALIAVLPEKLQWVRGRITAVMPAARCFAISSIALQWVRGRITAVIARAARGAHGGMNRFNGSAVG